MDIGDRVVITDGAFAGYFGTIVDWHDDGSAIVAIDAFDGATIKESPRNLRVVG